MARPDIYAYTAAANPFFVKSLAHKFGYEFDSDQPLNTVLQQLVAQEGEAALFEIIENNPDKELFLDYFKTKYGVKPDNCTCGNKSPEVDLLAASYMNFSGAIASQQIADNKKITNETTLMIIGGIFLISLVIISKKL